VRQLGKPSVIEYLIREGADITIEDSAGQTPIDLILEDAWEETYEIDGVKALLNAGREMTIDYISKYPYVTEVFLDKAQRQRTFDGVPVRRFEPAANGVLRVLDILITAGVDLSPHRKHPCFELLMRYCVGCAAVRQVNPDDCCTVCGTGLLYPLRQNISNIRLTSG
jgi:hypothetical protein